MSSPSAVGGPNFTVAALERIPSIRFAPSPFFRRYLGTDAGWYVIATTANVVAAFVVLPMLSRFSIMGTTMHRLPWAARLGVAVVLYDFAAFAVHVALHRSESLWSFHKVHHSSLQLDWLATTRAHMGENLVRQVSAQVRLVVLGMAPSTVAGALVVYAGFALYGHSNLRVGPRWLETVFITPRLHRVHHVPATSQHNLGQSSPRGTACSAVWSRLTRRQRIASASLAKSTPTRSSCWALCASPSGSVGCAEQSGPSRGTRELRPMPDRMRCSETAVSASISPIRRHRWR